MVGIDPLCASLHVGAGPTLIDRANPSGQFGSPLDEHIMSFGLGFTLGLSSECLGGPLVSPQGHDAEWEVFWGRCQAGQPRLG
jgi:hypothetical protein